MHTGAAGIRIIKNFEGCRLTPYLCPASKWTVGWGHVLSDVEHKTWKFPLTQEQADALLVKDLVRYENKVNEYAKVPLTQNQFDALVSFVYNCGFAPTLFKLLNKGDYAGAAREFPKWVRGGGKVLPGLVKRRAAERVLFEKV